MLWFRRVYSSDPGTSRNRTWPGAMALACGLAMMAPQNAAACPGYTEAASPSTIDRFYVERAIARVRDATEARAALLGRSSWIAPDAVIEIWDGDMGISGTGGLGLINAVQYLGLRRFRSFTPNSGPISVVWTLGSPCQHEVKTLFDLADPGAMAELTFRFVDGVLTRVSGSRGSGSEGVLEPALGERAR